MWMINSLWGQMHPGLTGGMLLLVHAGRQALDSGQRPEPARGQGCAAGNSTGSWLAVTQKTLGKHFSVQLPLWSWWSGVGLLHDRHLPTLCDISFSKILPTCIAPSTPGADTQAPHSQAVLCKDGTCFTSQQAVQSKVLSLIYEAVMLQARFQSASL